MLGKIRKKQLEEVLVQQKVAEPLVCPICDRLIPDSQKDAHHLVPKSKGGRETEYLHRICHRQIHALFNETELAKNFNTAQALKSHLDMQKFIAWIKNKPEAFYHRVAKSERIKK